MTDFYTFFKEQHGLSDHSITVLRNVFSDLTVGKEETFLHAGHAVHHVYIVAEGIVKSWFLREGRERILNFAFEGDVAVLPPDRHEYSQVSVTAIENAVLYRAHKEVLEDCFRQHAELAYWGYRMMKRAIVCSMDDYLNFLWMNKQKMYRYILEKHPDVLQRVPLKDVASFLNITPSSLSRIRAGVE